MNTFDFGSCFISKGGCVGQWITVFVVLFINLLGACAKTRTCKQHKYTDSGIRYILGFPKSSVVQTIVFTTKAIEVLVLISL